MFKIILFLILIPLFNVFGQGAEDVRVGGNDNIQPYERGRLRGIEISLKRIADRRIIRLNRRHLQEGEEIAIDNQFNLTV